MKPAERETTSVKLMTMVETSGKSSELETMVWPVDHGVIILCCGNRENRGYIELIAGLHGHDWEQRGLRDGLRDHDREHRKF